MKDIMFNLILHQICTLDDWIDPIRLNIQINMYEFRSTSCMHKVNVALIPCDIYTLHISFKLLVISFAHNIKQFVKLTTLYLSYLIAGQWFGK